MDERTYCLLCPDFLTLFGTPYLHFLTLISDTLITILVAQSGYERVERVNERRGPW